MRDALRGFVRTSECTHLGLAYDVLVETEAGKGKVAEKAADPWFEALAAIDTPEGYAGAYRRWRGSFEADLRGRGVEVALASRLLVGHGNAAPTDVGLTVHHTWGVPMIPGSALKGLLAQYLDAVAGPGPGFRGHPMREGLTEADQARARWRGVTWNGPRVQHGPGEFYRALFGAPAAPDDKEFGERAGETRGGVEFHDAWLVPAEPSTKVPVKADVLTVHQKAYYNKQGGQGAPWPNDYDDPNPVAFLSVPKGTHFLLVVTGPTDWTELALELLLDALAAWGVGGKTSSGYGRITPPPAAARFGPEQIAQRRQAAAAQRAREEEAQRVELQKQREADASREKEEAAQAAEDRARAGREAAARDPVVGDFMAWWDSVAMRDVPLRQRLVQARGEFGARFKAITDSELREQLRLFLRRKTKKVSVQTELEALLAEITE